MTQLLIAVVVVLLISAVVYVVVRSTRSRAPAPSPPSRPHVSGQAEVVLPVDDADPDNPATRRLVADAAERAFGADSEVVTVVVLSRGGRELGRVERSALASEKPFVDLPPELLEPHAQRHRGPHEPKEHEGRTGAPAHVGFEEGQRPQPRPQRSLAEHFELPDPVRARIRDPEDLVEIVRAILDEAGVAVDVDDDLLRSGDQALVVLRTPLHASVGTEDLNAAFLRFQRSGAKRGVMVTAGRLYAHESRRREALAPNLKHTGPKGIQRMADAVAMGANPLDFVVQ